MRGYYPTFEESRLRSEAAKTSDKLDLANKRLKFLKAELKRLNYEVSLRGKDPKNWSLSESTKKGAIK